MKKSFFIIITVVLLLAAVSVVAWQTGTFAKLFGNKNIDKSVAAEAERILKKAGNTNPTKQEIKEKSYELAQAKFPLKKGDKGDIVKDLQIYLKSYLSYTKKSFQYQNAAGKWVTAFALTADGILGNATLSAWEMYNGRKWEAGKVYTVSYTDFLILEAEMILYLGY